jgi:hypothetical protein
VINRIFYDDEYNSRVVTYMMDLLRSAEGTLEENLIKAQKYVTHEADNLSKLIIQISDSTRYNSTRFINLSSDASVQNYSYFVHYMTERHMNRMNMFSNHLFLYSNPATINSLVMRNEILNIYGMPRRFSYLLYSSFDQSSNKYLLGLLLSLDEYSALRMDPWLNTSLIDNLSRPSFSDDYAYYLSNFFKEKYGDCFVFSRFTLNSDGVAVLKTTPDMKSIDYGYIETYQNIVVRLFNVYDSLLSTSSPQLRANAELRAAEVRVAPEVRAADAKFGATDAKVRADTAKVRALPSVDAELHVADVGPLVTSRSWC